MTIETFATFVVGFVLGMIAMAWLRDKWNERRRSEPDVWINGAPGSLDQE